MTGFVRDIVSAFVRVNAAPMKPVEIEYARTWGLELPPRANVDPDNPETVVRALAWAAECFAQGFDPLAPEHTPTIH